MAGFLIDANLPYRFSLWRGPEYRHVFDLDDTWSDLQIWEYAKREDLTIVSKDTDFSALAMLNEPPPRVIHLRIGNMRMRELQALLRRSLARGPCAQPVASVSARLRGPYRRGSLILKIRTTSLFR